MSGVVVLEKFSVFVMCCSGLYLCVYPLIMTVLAVPCSPISNTAFSCLEMVLIKKSVLTLSTLGTRIEAYSGVLSEG